MVVPSLSILAEPPVTLVDRVADKHGTRKAAEAYLGFLYTEEAQAIIADNWYRPTSPAAVAKYASRFPKLNLVTVGDVFGGWQSAHKAHFADGAVFDQIFQPGR